jgi:hypothetical protein
MRETAPGFVTLLPQVGTPRSASGWNIACDLRIGRARRPASPRPPKAPRAGAMLCVSMRAPIRILGLLELPSPLVQAACPDARREADANAL